MGNPVTNSSFVSQEVCLDLILDDPLATLGFPSLASMAMPHSPKLHMHGPLLYWPGYSHPVTVQGQVTRASLHTCSRSLEACALRRQTCLCAPGHSGRPGQLHNRHLHCQRPGQHNRRARDAAAGVAE